MYEPWNVIAYAGDTLIITSSNMPSEAKAEAESDIASMYSGAENNELVLNAVNSLATIKCRPTVAVSNLALPAHSLAL